MAYNSGAPLFKLLFGGMFVVIGLYLVIGRFFWDSFKRRHTYYTLTDKRAFVATNTWKKSLRALPITTSSLVEYQPGKEATIILQRESRNTGEGVTTIEHGFEFINDGEKVYRLISEIQNGLYDKYRKK
ncbi:MAG TPA: hypothetical protein ENJ55_03605 [Rhizobiales bacterium]|nr:hypothetical protein [Hyphomicrobiales bacterium]